MVLLQRNSREILAGMEEGYRKNEFRRTIALISVKRGKRRLVPKSTTLDQFSSVQFILFFKCRIDKTQSLHEIGLDKVH